MIRKTNENKFIMSPKIDYCFKLIFGDEKNKDVLIDFLCSIIDIPSKEITSIEFLNTELPREFEEDKKGILDVRVRTIKGKHINIEIQLVKSTYMPERTLFYWAKMYTGQIKSGDRYAKLKKCITINIVDYEFLPFDKVHTKFDLRDDEKGYKLTDVIEIHFLELPKLQKINNLEYYESSLIDWLQFINADKEEVMEVLAKKNSNIKTAYEILKAASRDEKKRLAYESRQMAIMDEATRLEEARDEGIEKGKYITARKMKEMGLDIKIISKATDISIEILEKEIFND